MEWNKSATLGRFCYQQSLQSKVALFMWCERTCVIVYCLDYLFRAVGVFHLFLKFTKLRCFWLNPTDMVMVKVLIPNYCVTTFYTSRNVGTPVNVHVLISLISCFLCHPAFRKISPGNMAWLLVVLFIRKFTNHYINTALRFFMKRLKTALMNRLFCAKKIVKWSLFVSGMSLLSEFADFTQPKKF